jgi:hypothetical protein
VTATATSYDARMDARVIVWRQLGHTDFALADRIDLLLRVYASRRPPAKTRCGKHLTQTRSESVPIDLISLRPAEAR